jgi:hypothetical protein
VTILGRLNPGVSIAEAQSGLDPFLQEVEKSSALPQIERDESFAHVLLTPAPRGLRGARKILAARARTLGAGNCRGPQRRIAAGKFALRLRQTDPLTFLGGSAILLSAAVVASSRHAAQCASIR